MTVAALVDRWSAAWQHHYHERAAIMEYDGGMSRFDAEREAYAIVLAEREARPK